MSSAKPLERLPLNDGHSVPWLAFGTGTAFWKQDARQAALTAIQAGFRHLDTAQMYGNEDSLGDAIVESGVPRSEFFITTKLDKSEGETTVVESLKGSLKRLKLDYVDLFLIHIPADHQSTPTRLKEVWNGMVEAKKMGLTWSIGVSNFGIKHLEEVMASNAEVPTVNQIEYHPWLLNQQPLLDFHKKFGIVTAAYGGMTPLHPDRANKESLADGKLALDEAINNIRGALGVEVTSTQILLKWLKQKDILAVTTSTKETRIREYLSTENIPDLSDRAIRMINYAASSVHFRAFDVFPYLDDL